jgi:hypothetical protein
MVLLHSLLALVRIVLSIMEHGATTFTSGQWKKLKHDGE